MKKKFVKFSLDFSLDKDNFKYGEKVNSQLRKEVHLEFGSTLLRPIWILLVNKSALSFPSSLDRKPILIFEKKVGPHWDRQIENEIEGIFQCWSYFIYFCFPFIFFAKIFLHPTFQEIVGWIFPNLNRQWFTNTPKNPTTVQTNEEVENT